MDLLYLLGNGSQWDNNELRYSLRSACAHCLPMGNVIIAGDLPKWLRNVYHAPEQDLHTSKVRNQLRKLVAAVKSDALSEEFALMNDDFIFLEDHYALPAYVEGTLQQRLATGHRGTPHYYELAKHALQRLQREGIANPLNYDTHHPLPMTRTGALAMFKKFGGTGSVYAFRSIYGNFHRLPATPTKDCKFFGSFTQPPTLPLISIDAGMANDVEFRMWIEKRFPEKCRFES